VSAPVIERQDRFNGVVQRAQRTETLVEAVMFTSLQLVQVHYGEGVVNHTGPGVFPPAWARQITTGSGAMHATELARE